MSARTEQSAASSAAQEAQATIAFAELAVVRVLVVILMLAIFATALFWKESLRPLVPWAVALAAGLAAMLVGGVIGLLFGVPRRDATAASGSGYSGNDNLVKVSDWLTGALTGIALATARDMADTLWFACKNIHADYPGFALACIVGGFCAGFLLAYLRFRASLPFIFAHFDQRAKDVALMRDLAREKEARNLEATRSRSVEVEARYQGQAAHAKSWSDKIRVIREVMAKDFEGDPNKGQFGGAPQAGGFLLRMAGHRIGADGILNVDLEVAPVAARQVLTEAEFFLHPSFPAARIRKPADSDGVVRLSIGLYETFTVGVLVDPGQVRLELDLTELADIPEAYR